MQSKFDLLTMTFANIKYENTLKVVYSFIYINY